MRLPLLILLLAPALLRAAELPKELRGRFPAKIEKQLLAIQAKGEPLLWRQLNDWVPKVPAKQNAQIPIEHLLVALLENEFHKPYAAFRKAQWESKLRPDRGDPIPPKHLPLLQRLIESQKDILPRIHAASKYPKYRSAVNYNLGHKAINHQAAEITQFNRLLGHEAQWRAHHQLASAADSLLAQLAFVRHLDNEPWMIGRFLQLAHHGMTLYPTSHVLSQAVLTEPQLIALQKAHATINHARQLPKSIAYERALFLDVFFHPDDVIAKEEEKFIEYYSGADEWKDSGQALKMRTPADRHHDLNFFLKSIKQFQTIVRLPFPQQLKATEKFEQEMRQMMGDADDPDNPKIWAEPEHLISQQRLGYIVGKRISERTAKGEAYGATIQTAIAIERYRLGNKGKLPKTLNELTPKYLKTLPADPFTGKPVRFRKLKNEYRVYSVALDGKDNGGSSRHVNRQYDIVIRVRH